MTRYTTEDYINMEILVRPEQIPMVYAVLAGTARQAYVPNTGDRPETVSVRGSTAEQATNRDYVPADECEPDENEAPSETSSDEVDAHGWPWSPELHASTKGTTKDGLWRMKVGVTRPDPKPGFPKTDATPSSTSTASPATPVAATATEPAGSSPTEAPASAAASPDEDDEFAMFAAAAAKVNATEAAAAASVPARVWTDADLGALCNQAAMKLGDPAPVREVIASFVPAGEVQHSRNVPADKRADFAAAIEAKAGIEFSG